MTRISGHSKLIYILIALPYFRAQKHTSYLNISLMVICVLRNGWFSFTHTQFSSHPYSTHAALSGYPRSLYSRVTRSYICYTIYTLHIAIYDCPNFIALPLLSALLLAATCCAGRLVVHWTLCGYPISNIGYPMSCWPRLHAPTYLAF